MRHFIPLHLDLTGRRLLFVGGGRVNERRVLSVVESDAEITVVSPALTEKLKSLVDEGKIHWIEREFLPSDVEGADFVFVAIPEGYQKVVECAKAKGVWVECASDGNLGNFIVPAVIRRKHLLISVSTSGQSPKLTARIKRAIEELLGKIL